MLRELWNSGFLSRSMDSESALQFKGPEFEGELFHGQDFLFS